MVIAVIGIFTNTASAVSVTAAQPPNNRLAAPVVATNTPTPDPCGLAWRVVASPNPPNNVNDLRGVDALSQNNVWAIGDTGDISSLQPLALHWDGTSWAVASMPVLPNGGSLYGITALSTTDMWAVGVAYTETLTMHWNGSQWLRVPSPSVAGEQNQLTAVSAVSPGDVWAVGYYCCTGGLTNASQTLILHWDDTQWSQIASPNVGSWGNRLNGVAAFASNDVWAVGGGGAGAGGAPLSMHWDGTTWTVIDTPPGDVNGGSYPYGLSTVGGVSGNDVWAAGIGASGYITIVHWDGSLWTIVPAPDQSTVPQAIQARTSSDVWMVGYDPGAYAVTTVFHWDGSAWSIVPNPSPTNGDGQFMGVSVIGANDVWAVGMQSYSGQVQTLTEHYSDPCITPSPTSTGAPPTATPTASPTATPSCPLGWNVVASPNSGSNSNHLNSVVSVSPTEAWAVGYYVNNSGVEQTLTMNRSGDQWQIIASPDAGSNTDNRLTSVAVVSANNIWAAGYYTNGPVIQTLALHWDGSGWTVIATPNTGTSYNYIYGLTAIAANDIWAVGTSDNGALTLHWNGTQWTAVSNPGSGYNYSLAAVAAVASNDVWAVGTQTFLPYPDTLAMHWDGTAWTIVPTPSPGGQYDDQLTGVSVVSASDVWAVGSYVFNEERLTLALHWDGTAWTQIDSPRPPGESYLEGVSVSGSNSIWAAGYYLSGSPTLTQTLIMHWNGSAWGIAPAPSPGGSESVLSAVAGVSTNEALAVGYADTGGAVDRTLIERYLAACSGSTATPTGVPATTTSTPSPTRTTPAGTPTATATGTPTATATATGTRPTSTSTRALSSTPAATNTPGISPTATSCLLQFADVPEGSTFYPYVRCLACRGIVAGYSDGTFKPNNNVTRGQLAKIVSNSAGFNDPAGAQIFQDVPPGSTFYSFIQRLAARGYMGGYECGGPGEPCVPPENLPYFRPNNNATRGQISKIVSNAAGFNDPPQGQTFEDVAPGSTFYDFIYRLAFRGYMSGYPCGGAGEPCVPPANLPYFRPNNNATRGQTSKIVGNTFFPACQTPMR